MCVCVWCVCVQCVRVYVYGVDDWASARLLDPLRDVHRVCVCVVCVYVQCVAGPAPGSSAAGVRLVPCN